MAKGNGEAADPSRRRFISFGAGVAAASVVEIPLLSGSSQDRKIASLESELGGLQSQAAQANQLQSQIDQTTAQAQSTQSLLSMGSGFLHLNIDEQQIIEAAAETIIPSDSNGPGAKEAGVIYFIDRQLASDYGACGTMYMKGPFFMAGQQAPITLNGQTYEHGTPVQRVDTGTRYQYPMDLRYFWRYGVDALQAYSTSTYGAPFQNLSSSEKSQVLTDLWNNKPTSFNGIVPLDFAFELFFMVWSGFFTDPLYGGNVGMAGWQYLGFNGTNLGDFYGEGETALSLATAKSPTPLRPASAAQFQQKNG
jgi:hypothetical protein